MIKSILVPMGDSVHSEEALSTGIALAEKFNARLQGVYVKDAEKIKTAYMLARPGPFFDVSGAHVSTEIIQEMEEGLIEEEEKVKNIFARHTTDLKDGCDCKLEITAGFIADEILDWSRTVDLIILGKAINRTFDGKINLGDSVKAIIQKSPKPTLVVTSGHKPGKNALVAYDGSVPSNKALREGASFIKELGGQVSVLIVNDTNIETDKLMQEAETYLKPYEILTEKIIKDSDSVSVAIKQIVSEKGTDLLVMGAYGDSKFKEFLMGSTTEETLKKIDCPVLLMA